MSLTSLIKSGKLTAPKAMQKGPMGPKGPKGMTGLNGLTGMVGSGPAGASSGKSFGGMTMMSSKPDSPSHGQMFYDDHDADIKMYDGKAWVTLAPQGGQVNLDGFLESANNRAIPLAGGMVEWDYVRNSLYGAPYLRKMAILNDALSTILEKIKCIDDIELAEMEIATYAEISNDHYIPVELANLFVILEKASQEILKG